ncbi:MULTISPECIES: hypothetical protein [unclassified Nonomuraea]|uniref:terpene synthase family protein n=1 Tax=unclassified Nonomuraea TaxID=2593643 RepID=UPI003400A112
MTTHDDVTLLTLPSLTCPFPLQVSPHADAVQSGTQEWIRRFGVLTPQQLRHFDRAAYGQLAARVYPYARQPLLQLASDWCGWLFAIDDVIYEEDDASTAAVGMIPELRRVLAGLHAGTTGFGRALADIRARIAAQVNADQLHRWTAATGEYLFAQTWEKANRSGHQVPALDAYVTMRRFTGAMYTVYALIDVVAEQPLTAELWADPQVRAICRHAGDVVVWDNDLISWPKERLSSNGLNNLVMVLTTHASLSVPQAVERIVEMREEAVGQVAALGELLIARRQENVIAFVRGLQSWISGSVAYSLRSSRYLATAVQE